MWLNRNDRKHGAFGCAGFTRFIILAVAVLYMASLQANLSCLAAAFVPMMDKTTSPLYPLYNQSIDEVPDWASSQLSIDDRRFSFGFIEKGLSFAGGLIGPMIGTFPLGIALRKFGSHKTMIVLGSVNTVLTALTPLVLSWSVAAFVVLRIVNGLTVSITFPVSGLIVNEWASVNEKGIFVACLSAYIELCLLLTVPITGLVATQISWPAVFYLHAATSGILTIIWAVFYRNTPSEHPFVSEEELKKIGAGKAAVSTKIEYPLRQILLSPAVWAIMAAVVGYYTIVQFIAFSQIYLSYVLNYSPNIAGYLSILPLVMLLFIKFFTGLLSDHITRIEELVKARVFNSLALFGAAACFILVAVVRPSGTIIDVILCLLPVALIGFGAGGFPKATVTLSRQHSPLVFSVGQVIAYVTGAICSFGIPILTPNDTYEEWRFVFVIYVVGLVVTNLIFVLFVKTEPATWTRTSFIPISAPIDEKHVFSPKST